MKASVPKVAILMGSDSDLPIMMESAKTLEEFGIPYDLRVLSAHRSPDDVHHYVKDSKTNGIRVFICGAGGAAHLAGMVASLTTVPVIGIPIDSSPLKGLDALLATVQMPSGTPVATVAIGKSGAKNAAILACQILALSEEGLSQKLESFKKKLAEGIRRKNEELREGAQEKQ